MFPEMVSAPPLNPEAAKMQKSKYDEMVKFAVGIPSAPMDARSLGGPREPTVEDMEKQAEAARYDKLVKVKSINVRTFDLSDTEEARKYCELYAELYVKALEARVVITERDKKFVVGADGERPRWVLHIEWMEYELEVKDHMMTRKEDNAKQ